MGTEALAAQLLQRYAGLEGAALLDKLIHEEFRGRIAVTSSFGAESAVLLALVAEVDKTTPVIFLDTGELFDETHSYRSALEERLGLTNIVTVKPEPEILKQADELWRTDTDRCCELRKVAPMAKAVAGYAALVDGRKRAHGFDRAALPTIEAAGEVIKVSPLAPWSAERIEAEFEARGLPRHPLVAQGYRSIGCWPCTRPTAPGEPARAGRWAGSAKTECGIHTAKLAGK